MIASFHLVKYRQRRFRPGAVTEVEGRPFWRILSTGPDFRLVRPGFRWFDLAKPNFRRWGFFGTWRDERSLESFLATAALPEKPGSDCEEAWHVRMNPIRSMGTWQDQVPLGSFEQAAPPDGPVIALTRGDLRPAKLAAFWLSGAKTAVGDVRSADGFLAGIAMTERPFFEVATLTVWSSIDRAMDFAYRRQAHSSLVVRNRKERIFTTFFAAYFSPFRSAGTWNGLDPVARRAADQH